MKAKLIFLFIAIALNCHSQSPVGQFIKDPRSGCRIWDEAYAPEDKVTWTGGCKKGYAEGTGTLRWYAAKKVVAVYTGEMKMGKPNGQGKYQIDGYGLLTGNFKDGLLNGKGAAYFNNGGKTIGNFDHGEFLNLDDKYLPLLIKKITSIKDTTGIYSNGAALGDMLHYAFLAPRTEIKAVLVLFPSTGETVANVISCNRQLMQQACEQGIISVVPGVNYNKSLESDPSAMAFIDYIFSDLVNNLHAPKDKFVMMGLSLGGENALQYTEMSRNSAYRTYLKPLACIGVDPPVDLADLYQRAKKQIVVYEKEGKQLSESKQMALKENHFLVESFDKEYGGPPEQYPDRYIQGSQYTINSEDGGNAKYLLKVPVRLYCDPDILWQLKNKGRDYYSMNAAALSAMVNFLTQNGNKEAELIPALGKGFRVDGRRHPHSWSIVDPGDCIKWINKLSQNKLPVKSGSL